MLTLEQYIINEQIDQILEDLNSESINEGKITRAIKKFWRWLFSSDDTYDKDNSRSSYRYYTDHLGILPDDLDEDEIKGTLKKQKFNYIDFKNIDKETNSNTPVSFIKTLIKQYPGQFKYIEELLSDSNSILNLIGDNNIIQLGLLYCDDPFNKDDKKKILFCGICLYIYKLNVNTKVLEKIKKYSGSSDYDNYGFIICLDIMNMCNENNTNYRLENKLYSNIIRKVKDYNNSTSYSGISTIINMNSYGQYIKDFFTKYLKYNVESNDNNKIYKDTIFLYNKKL